ncbi:unnamed protein product [Macrosiphum euphorbiae]|uniref:Uncharacterized protein n=1 Tax=Macrosiphum euphorbiae TaxID=13131 RepID=A0AAV0VSF1_9HEMI|nr:unnamed protein product [Macrosiphum euphorbiae]
METSQAISLVTLALSVGFAIFHEWDNIVEIFNKLSGNRPMIAGELSEEVLETLRREREAEEQSIKEKLKK